MGEVLDVILDGSAIHARRWTQGGWLDANAQFIRRIDFVLDRLQIKEPIESIEQYWKHWLIKTNQLTDWEWLIGETKNARK